MTKSQARQASAPGRKRQSDPVAFVLQLEVRPGLPLDECQRFERRLEDYARVQGLDLTGHQLRQIVTAPDRAVTCTDQVALIDWLVDQPGLVAVRVGPVTSLAQVEQAHAFADSDPADDEPTDAAFVQVRTGDLALIGLTLLYRCGRIAPALYLQILGGYVRPANVH